MTLLKALTVLNDANPHLLEKVEGIEYFDSDEDYRLSFTYSDTDFNEYYGYIIDVFYDGTSSLSIHLPDEVDHEFVVPDEILQVYAEVQGIWKNFKKKI